MFVRAKKSGAHFYLQVVHNERVQGHVRQNVIATLGRLDLLQQSGQVDALLSSLGRFAEHAAVLNAQRQGDVPPAQTQRIGPVLVCERLWRSLGFPEILAGLLRDRKFGFAVERAIFLTVLHRLFVSGSDRAAERWRHQYAIAGTAELELHHLYRAMAWLGETLAQEEQDGHTLFAPRCIKDRIEEELFARRRDLFSNLELTFFDTTSIYFEGEGGESLGEYGHSKDHRPDRKQLIVGLVSDGQGRPICCEMWPGNTTDVNTLVPIVDRLRQRFAITSICIVADRGMISKATMERLQSAERNTRYLLGARLRAAKEIREQVLSRAGRYHVVNGPRQKAKDPSPLKVKEVWVEERRYIVCHNEEQARKDRADREAILDSLRERLRQGPVSLVGNKGYRKFLSSEGGGGLHINEDKVRRDARFDGKWVLQTDTDLSPAECALKYKDLLLVEQIFRSLKSILETRPIYHKCDETIRGHVFCSFLAMVLLKELFGRMAERGWQPEWAHVRDDLDALEEVTLQLNGKTFVVRSQAKGQAGKALQAAGVALGSVVRLVQEPQPSVPGVPECSANEQG